MKKEVKACAVICKRNVGAKKEMALQPSLLEKIYNVIA